VRQESDRSAPVEGGRGTRGIAAAASLAVSAAVALALSTTWPAVENRLAFGWDAALRATADLDAASGPLRFLVRLLGPEVWPTLRLAVLAPLLALGAPPLPTEAAAGIAAAVLTFLALGWVAAREARDAGRALLAVAGAAGALAACGAFTTWAASPMLEAQAALFTLLGTAAWMRMRAGGESAAAWPVALAGNLLFHTKFQYGLLLAGAVLVVEAASLPGRVRARVALALLGEGRGWFRRPAAWAILAAVILCGAAAWAVDRTGGLAFRLGPLPVSVRRAAGPAFWAAFLAFYGLLLGLWRSRARFRADVPWQLRALWVWLAVPMGAWLLVPFAWRLRMLVYTAATFQAGAPPPGRLLALAYYPRAIWEDWWPPPALAAVGAGLVLTALAAVRDAALRRRLVAPLAVVVVEILALGLGSSANFQPRFAVNLAPLLALGAVAWLPTAASRWAPAAGAALTAVLWATAVPAWRPAPLAARLSGGYGERQVAETCAALVKGLALRDGALVVDLAPGWRQDCILQLQLQAFRQEVRIVEWERGTPLPRVVMRLSDRCDLEPPPPGLRLERRAGPVCLRVGR